MTCLFFASVLEVTQGTVLRVGGELCLQSSLKSITCSVPGWGRAVHGGGAQELPGFKSWLCCLMAT